MNISRLESLVTRSPATSRLAPTPTGPFQPRLGTSSKAPTFDKLHCFVKMSSSALEVPTDTASFQMSRGLHRD